MFDRRGDRYHGAARLLVRRLHRGVAAEVAESGLPAGGNVLDIGCGPGLFLREIAERRPDLRLTGIDLSPSMIEVARRVLAESVAKTSVRLDNGDAGAMPYADASFDLIVSTISMHHWQEPERVVAEAFRVLGPGGGLWVYDASFGRFEGFKAGVERAFGRRPERSLRRFGPLGLPLIAKFASERAA